MVCGLCRGSVSRVEAPVRAESTGRPLLPTLLTAETTDEAQQRRKDAVGLAREPKDKLPEEPGTGCTHARLYTKNVNGAHIAADEDAVAVELHLAEIDTRDVSTEVCVSCHNEAVGVHFRSLWQAPLTTLARHMRGSVGWPIEEQRYDEWANDFYNNCFYAKRIKVDGVERELAYAKTGSAVPRSLHGIFWMDMLYQSSIAKDPAYENKPWWIKDLQAVFPNIAPAMVAPDRETLIAFGDKPARWFPEEKILKNVGYCGEKGHWSFPNVTSGEIEAEGVMHARMNADLVFENEDMTQAYVSARVRDPLTKMWIEAPRCAFEMLMFKTEWGWDRKTTVGNVDACMQHSEVIEQLMPSFVKKVMELGATPNQWNYPMVQIVDGDGNRTKYYDEYLKFMKYWDSDEQIVIARQECKKVGCFSC